MRLKISGLMARYIGKQFLLSFVLFLGVFTAIIELFELIEMLRRAAERENITFWISLKLTFYKLPSTLQEILPFVILFASMHSLWKLTKSQELVIVRAAGISIWEFLSPIILCAAAIGVIQFSLISPISATFTSKYQVQENKYFNNQASTLNLKGSGFWLRQDEEYGEAFIHAKSASAGLKMLKDVSIFMLKNDEKQNPTIYAGRINAQTALLSEGKWELKNVWLYLPNQKSTFVESHIIETEVTANQIEESFSSPATISFWQLPAFIKTLEATGFPTLKHKMHFLSLLSLPILYMAMAFLAAAFSLQHTRKGGTLLMVSGGVATGLGLYVFKNITVALGVSETLPLFMAAWVPAISALMLGVGILMHLEDG